MEILRHYHFYLQFMHFSTFPSPYVFPTFSSQWYSQLLSLSLTFILIPLPLCFNNFVIEELYEYLFLILKVGKLIIFF